MDLRCTSKKGLFVLVTLFALLISQRAEALEIEPNAVFIRVIDVGSGLACVVRMPGDFYMVYDAGHFSGQGKSAFEGVQSVIPAGREIDLLVLSHSDSDHLGFVNRKHEEDQRQPEPVNCVFCLLPSACDGDHDQ